MPNPLTKPFQNHALHSTQPHHYKKIDRKTGVTNITEEKYSFDCSKQRKTDAGKTVRIYIRSISLYDFHFSA